MVQIKSGDSLAGVFRFEGAFIIFVALRGFDSPHLHQEYIDLPFTYAMATHRNRPFRVQGVMFPIIALFRGLYENLTKLSILCCRKIYEGYLENN